MTSATLFREGLDLDEMLAELDAEHDGQVRVVDVEYGRNGGVMGFFAKRTVGVHYVVSANGGTREPIASPLETLLRAAEAKELASGIVESGRVPDDVPETTDDNVEFARMLLDIANQKAAERRADVGRAPAGLPASAEVASPALPQPRRARPSPAAPARPPAGERTAVCRPAAAEVGLPQPDLAGLCARARTRPVGAHRAADPVPAVAPSPRRTFEPPPPVAAQSVAQSVAQPVAQSVAQQVVQSAAPVRTPLTLRRQLSEIGVPLDWIGDGSDSAYEMIEQLVRRVPIAPHVDPAPGQLLVVAGPAVHARAEAERLCARLRLDPGAIRTAGCGADPIRNCRQAAALELEARSSHEPRVAVVATDSSGDAAGVADLAWAADIITTLAPDELYVVVDATCRVTDLRRTLAALGRVSALAVVAAARAASPASLWELGVAVASLDGSPATRGRWAALLIDRLGDLDGH